ncbi:hypothetical protein MVES1_001407 [Malassezia vespertilionis]|uniref:Brix domain-containing protein n=1 Tax=Malassezia vespertilionis TaxID=2020962 RepID=A0A2N1JDU5_9BASI|nr:uncharacterized protein MVES1_001407 [Malassezia vespertilionis]PKI84721.1 hypothetical protein MVES_001327 [Malassezia vespertilionis]WFD06068.1 hypothetical protein MVES1_001407 [Malassezia vespertilionis]
MEPNTASRLRERDSNKLRDFLAMTGPLGVSHMLIFSQTDAGANLRILRAPRGPTVTFRINKFALAGDVLHSSRRPMTLGAEYNSPPLLVLNNFGGEERHVKLLVTVFQNLFPPLHVHSMRLAQVRRIVLLNYNAETKTVDWRHYLISVRPVGVSRSVRRIIEGSTRTSSASAGSVTGHGGEHKRHGRALVNLANATDIAEYVMRGSAAMGGEDTDTSEAESEAEDMADPKNAVELSQNYLGRSNAANTQRAVRLREIGPRMELRLVKIEEGLNGSEVLYHDYVQKSAKQVAQQTRALAEKKRIASSRRMEQERNVERKKQEKAARKVAFADEEEEEEEEEEDEEDEGDDDEFAYEDEAVAPSTRGDRDIANDVLDSDEDLFDDDEAPSEADMDLP